MENKSLNSIEPYSFNVRFIDSKIVFTIPRYLKIIKSLICAGWTTIWLWSKAGHQSVG